MRGFISAPKPGRLWLWLLSFWKVRNLTDTEVFILNELLNGRWNV